MVVIGTSQEVCARCGTRLIDASSVVENDGTLYCCGNCLVHATTTIAPTSDPAAEFCAQCGLRLVDTRSRVRRGSRVYCCANCAQAFLEVGEPVTF